MIVNYQAFTGALSLLLLLLLVPILCVVSVALISALISLMGPVLIVLGNATFSFSLETLARHSARHVSCHLYLCIIKLLSHVQALIRKLADTHEVA